MKYEQPNRNINASYNCWNELIFLRTQNIFSTTLKMDTQKNMGNKWTHRRTWTPIFTQSILCLSSLYCEFNKLTKCSLFFALASRNVAIENTNSGIVWDSVEHCWIQITQSAEKNACVNAYRDFLRLCCILN